MFQFIVYTVSQVLRICNYQVVIVCLIVITLFPQLLSFSINKKYPTKVFKMNKLKAINKDRIIRGKILLALKSIGQVSI